MIRSRLFLFACAAFALSSAANAADNAIKVVNPDGTVSVLALPSAKSAGPSAADLLRQQAMPAAPEAELKPVPVEKPVAAPSEKQKAKPAAEVKKAEKPTKARPAKEKKAKKDKKGKKSAVAAPAPVAAEPVRPRGPVDADTAVRLALDVAPPARGYDVSRRTYHDRPVWQVTFRTEDGPHDVLVDIATGDLLKR